MDKRCHFEQNVSQVPSHLQLSFGALTLTWLIGWQVGLMAFKNSSCLNYSYEFSIYAGKTLENRQVNKKSEAAIVVVILCVNLHVQCESKKSPSPRFFQTCFLKCLEILVQILHTY